MPDALSVAELEEQRVELLPARTVLSMFSTGDDWYYNDGHYHDHDDCLLGLLCL
ncbi:MAG TPA: hypothetical protein VFO16_03955 [Pseudonocardiaceae bacterium]|nr:hypothetical protein [Pseudonocardiaceae bacterium]